VSTEYGSPTRKPEFKLKVVNMSYRYVVLRKCPSTNCPCKAKPTTVLIIFLLQTHTICIEYLVVLELTTDGTCRELHGVGVGKEALGVSLKLRDGECGSGVGWLLVTVLKHWHE